jgi:hypothetical protein
VSQHSRRPTLFSSHWPSPSALCASLLCVAAVMYKKWRGLQVKAAQRGCCAWGSSVVQRIVQTLRLTCFAVPDLPSACSGVHGGTSEHLRADQARLYANGNLDMIHSTSQDTAVWQVKQCPRQCPRLSISPCSSLHVDEPVLCVHLPQPVH